MIVIGVPGRQVEPLRSATCGRRRQGVSAMRAAPWRIFASLVHEGVHPAAPRF